MKIRPTGKLPFVPNQDDLFLKRYIDKDRLIGSSQVPMALNWAKFPTPSGNLPVPDTDPLGNNQYQCCVFSGAAHLVRLVGQLTGNPRLAPTAEDVKNAYFAATLGLDVGFSIRTLIGIWMTKGLFGTKALAATLVDNSPEERAIAAWLGCGTLCGFRLPPSYTKQDDGEGRPFWRIPVGGFPPDGTPGKAGLHCIYEHSPAPTTDGGISWGEHVTWTSEWGYQCEDERWLIILDAWPTVTNVAPNGFDLQQLLSDVRARINS
jgi:hypothetical protein